MIQKINGGGCYFNGREITAQEYEEILDVIHNKPEKTDTTDYRLKEDLTWEAYEVPPPDPDPELDAAEAFEVIFGGDEK